MDGVKVQIVIRDNRKCMYHAHGNVSKCIKYYLRLSFAFLSFKMNSVSLRGVTYQLIKKLSVCQ